MPTLHKNISAEVDIHNPKWFPNANNGDVSWKNELGVLESTDELVLPSALDFVDASVAPPTTNLNDIYVLASGGSVNAGWGSVALDDWVRYDGTDWNSITPQKSTLCYDEDTDKLYAYDGTDWVLVGGDSMYTADDTITDVDRIITYDSANGSSLEFRGGINSGTHFTNGNDIYLWDGLKTVSNEMIRLYNSGGTSRIDFSNSNGRIEGGGAGLFLYGNVQTASLTSTLQMGAEITLIPQSTRDTRIYGRGVRINSSGAVSSTNEKLSVHGLTAIKGTDTSSATGCLELYDSATTKIFDVRNNGDIYTNGTQGLSNTYTFGGGGSGDIASMTYTNGILTAVTTVP